MAGHTNHPLGNCFKCGQTSMWCSALVCVVQCSGVLWYAVWCSGMWCSALVSGAVLW